jgi:hypothetical protein
MCLDVVRALSRETHLVEALISDLTEMSDGCSVLTGELSHLMKLIRLNSEMLETSARILCQQLVLIAQRCLLRGIRLGYIVEKTGESQRILPHSIQQRFETSSSGALVPVTEGSTKPVTVQVAHAGIATVEQFDLRMP